MSENILTIEQLDHVTVVTLNRPENLNALNPDLLGSIERTFLKLEKDPDLRAVIITGAGPKAFVAGADISSMHGLGSRAIADYLELGQRTMRAIECCKVPVIAQVNGYALGGGLELALACDLIIASETAKFGQPEVNLGILPGFGGTQRLIARCGIGVSRRLCYTAELASASEALAIGLVDRVVQADLLTEEARKLATLIASKAPLAVQATKKVIRVSEDPRLLPGLRHEVQEFLALFATSDREEGMEAFLTKRPARFTGR